MKRLFVWLKPRAAIGLWLCLLFLCLVLGVRVLWIASRNETGLTTLRLQWRDATVGWILGEHQSISMQEPPEQAEYWLRETDRI
jgi:hypothetical protein